MDLGPWIEATRAIEAELDRERVMLDAHVKRAAFDPQHSEKDDAQIEAINLEMSGKKVILGVVSHCMFKGLDHIKKKIQEQIDEENREIAELQTHKPAGWEQQVDFMKQQMKGKLAAQAAVAAL